MNRIKIKKRVDKSIFDLGFISGVKSKQEILKHLKDNIKNLEYRLAFSQTAPPGTVIKVSSGNTTTSTMTTYDYYIS